MQAHAEILSAIIRVGPETDKYGAPYDYVVTISSVDGKTAIVKGLVSEGSFTVLHAKTIIKKIRELGLEPEWERIR